MSISRVWAVYLFAYWQCCYGETTGARFNATVMSYGTKTACCTWIEDPLPSHVIKNVISITTDCGSELIFFLSSGHNICVPNKGWAKHLACIIRSEKAAYSRVSWLFTEIAEILKLNYRTYGFVNYTTVDVDLEDFMFAVSDIYEGSRSQSRRRYEYRVWDGSSWIKCFCDLRLRMSSQFFPEGFNPDKAKAAIDCTLDITFSAADGDVFTRCTHNHVYDKDVFSVPPVAPSRLVHAT